ncbi:MAG: hypothetical protein KDG89_06810 [Geminicoccaceae bacterium]|nr:hypothetical protein [Geminicoccaceae bacterium]
MRVDGPHPYLKDLLAGGNWALAGEVAASLAVNGRLVMVADPAHGPVPVRTPDGRLLVDGATFDLLARMDDELGAP